MNNRAVQPGPARGICAGRALVCSFLACLAACAPTRPLDVGTLEPLPAENGAPAFKFTARTEAAQFTDPIGSEAERMRWLQQRLAENSMCAAGFDIADRQVDARTPKGEPMGEVRYRGRCRT